jgi:DnaJ-class molecular chaperone
MTRCQRITDIDHFLSFIEIKANTSIINTLTFDSAQKSTIHNQTKQMQKKNYYQILGIPINASKQTIRSSYLTLAKKYHPDTNHTGDCEQFKLVNKAYETLYDESKRQIYDWKSQSPTTTNYYPHSYRMDFDDEDLKYYEMKRSEFERKVRNATMFYAAYHGRPSSFHMMSPEEKLAAKKQARMQYIYDNVLLAITVIATAVYIYYDRQKQLKQQSDGTNSSRNRQQRRSC